MNWSSLVSTILNQTSQYWAREVCVADDVGDKGVHTSSLSQAYFGTYFKWVIIISFIGFYWHSQRWVEIGTGIPQDGILTFQYFLQLKSGWEVEISKSYVEWKAITSFDLEMQNISFWHFWLNQTTLIFFTSKHFTSFYWIDSFCPVGMSCNLWYKVIQVP